MFTTVFFRITSCITYNTLVFAIFTTVCFRITSCITFTTSPVALLLVLAAKNSVTVLTNVFFMITICQTLFIASAFTGAELLLETTANKFYIINYLVLFTAVFYKFVKEIEIQVLLWIFCILSLKRFCARVF